jgi:hypothetical protein
MHPSLATADAKRDSEIATPIPPWIIGILAVKSPMIRGFTTVSGTSRTDPLSKEYSPGNVRVKIVMDKRF